MISQYELKFLKRQSAYFEEAIKPFKCIKPITLTDREIPCYKCEECKRELKNNWELKIGEL